MKKWKLSFNSPVVLCFVLISFVILVVSAILGDWVTNTFFCVYRSSFTDPKMYVRMFTHVLGHAGFDHWIGNITLLLIIGPLLEEKYGSASMVVVILVTAFITGLVNILLFPGVALLGASGVVFAFIMLSSFTSMKEGRLPLTFVLVAIVYLGGQVYDGIFLQDNVSNLSHILGGLVGE